MPPKIERPATIALETWEVMSEADQIAAAAAAAAHTTDSGSKSTSTKSKKKAETSGTTSEDADTGSTDAAADAELTSFVDGVGSFSATERALLSLLLEVNGQDAYSNEAQALGRLGKNEYLILPIGFVPPTVTALEVGTKASTSKFKLKDLAEIYVVNKAVAPAGADAVKYGMARMEAVKMGWVTNQREITRAAPLAGAVTTFIADLKDFDVEAARQAAYLVPFAAEHVFRTTGHHYLSGQSGEYDRKYGQLFKSCLADKVAEYQPPSVLYHALFHWVSPARVWEVLTAKAGTDTLPEAFSLRVSSAPAGTAIITTTAAVIEQLEAAALLDDFKKLKLANFQEVKNMSAMIKANPPKYHKVPHAYGLQPLNAADRAAVEHAAAEAIKIAPIAQGFIEALFANAALGRAKVFKKHADENPIATKKAKAFFRSASRATVVEIKDIFAGTAVTDAKLRRAKKMGAQKSANEESDDETDDEE